MSLDLAEQENAFFEGIRAILSEARGRAYSSVNFIMVETYWKIGQRIVEEEQGGQAKAAYGGQLIKELSKRLGDEFGKGFSVSNLWNFRQFYLTFPDREKLYALRRELSWSHYRLIMRVEDTQARDYYVSEAANQGWSSRQLERNIRSGWHRRLLTPTAVTNESRVPGPRDIIKDPYVLEFLDLPEDQRLHEAKLETALIGKLTHQDIGQMDMYARLFDDLKRGTDDNPTLGIILCADKDETIVHYSVLHNSEQLFASKYLRVLPSEEDLARELEARHVLEIDRGEESDE